MNTDDAAEFMYSGFKPNPDVDGIKAWTSLEVQELMAAYAQKRVDWLTNHLSNIRKLSSA